MFECDIAHRRSVAVLCMYAVSNLAGTRYTLIMVLYHVPHVPSSAVTHGALVAHRYTYAAPRCRTSQYLITFSPLSVSLWNDLAGPVFDGVGLEGQCFFIGLISACSLYVFNSFHLFFFLFLC